MDSIENIMIRRRPCHDIKFSSASKVAHVLIVQVSYSSKNERVGPKSDHQRYSGEGSEERRAFCRIFSHIAGCLWRYLLGCYLSIHFPEGQQSQSLVRAFSFYYNFC